MTWLKIDDAYFLHPKSRAAGKDGRALDLAAICYCSSALTDGFVSSQALPMLLALAEVKRGAAQTLVDVGRWEAVEGGWMVTNDGHRCGTSSRWVDLGFAQVESRAARASTRRPLPVELRTFVIRRDGYVCGLCGGAVEPEDVHIDHVQPVSLGGSDDAGNLQVAHSRCNLVKGARV